MSVKITAATQSLTVDDLKYMSRLLAADLNGKTGDLYYAMPLWVAVGNIISRLEEITPSGKIFLTAAITDESKVTGDFVEEQRAAFESYWNPPGATFPTEWKTTQLKDGRTLQTRLRAPYEEEQKIVKATR